MKKIKYKKPKISKKVLKLKSRRNYNFFNYDDFLYNQNLLASGGCGSSSKMKQQES